MANINIGSLDRRACSPRTSKLANAVKQFLDGAKPCYYAEYNPKRCGFILPTKILATILYQELVTEIGLKLDGTLDGLLGFGIALKVVRNNAAD